MAIKTGPLPPSSNIHNYKETRYELTESTIRGNAEIIYDHHNKVFDKFEIKFDGLKVDQLTYLIYELTKIRNEVHPPKHIESEKKKRWFFRNVFTFLS